uniref:cAMP-regulated phosphoprotein 19-related protein n=1 Tax=Chenopodium quinoa TaxID=63459 RepID=A0A803NAF6_CHEQI
MGMRYGAGEAVKMADYDGREDYLASQNMDEPSSTSKKYGGLVPKKKPLISKDHERAFFDSADWALCKQGATTQKSTTAVESLRPKLQVRRLVFYELSPLGWTL